MSKILVKLSTNWADEMDIDGYQILTHKEWQDKQEEYKKAFNQAPQEIYFGTNQENYYDELEDYMSEISAQEISEDEADVLIKYLGKSYGNFAEPYYEEDY